MKIIDVEPIILQQALKERQKFAYSQAWYDTRTIMILKITTDDGIVGWGESFGPAFIQAAVIESVFKYVLMGMDPLDTKVIWEKMYSCLHDHGQAGVVIEAISAVDIALWDIKGKYFSKPIYKLMGGAHREYVIPYATGLYHRETDNIIDELQNEAAGYVQDGFKGVKLKIGFGIESDVERTKAIREVIGDDVALMIDANHAYNAREAILLGKQLEDQNITWFEEPVPPEDYEGYKEVKRNISIPIAGGECEFTKYGYSRLIMERCVDIVQPDCCMMGGISEYTDLIPFLKAANIQSYPHIWGSAIAVAAGIQVAFAQPNFPYRINAADVWLELDRTENIFREKLSCINLDIKNGKLNRPEQPGLGVDVDLDLIKKFRIN